MLLCTPQYGKDFYYRAHPKDLKKFYELVDEFHRMYDVVTEFDALSGMAAQLVPGEGKERWGQGELMQKLLGN